MTFAPYPWAYPEPPRPRRSRRPLIIGGALAALILIIGGTVLVTVAVTRGLEPAAAATVSPLSAARERCAPAGEGAVLSDEGRTLIIDTTGDTDYTGISYTQLECILGVVQAPPAVVTHIRATRAMDGLQKDRWANLTATWTFHPDNGVSMTIQTAG